MSPLSLCVCVCVCVCVRACMRACVRACMRFSACLNSSLEFFFFLLTETKSLIGKRKPQSKPGVSKIHELISIN